MVKTEPWTADEIDRLCELVSEDRMSFGRIAQILGRSRNQVTSKWSRIADDMERKLARRNRANGFS